MIIHRKRSTFFAILQQNYGLNSRDSLPANVASQASFISVMRHEGIVWMLPSTGSVIL